MKYFYDIYSIQSLQESFLYSFGFNGYIENLEGLIDNINNKHIHLASFNKEKEKEKEKGKRNKLFFENSYHPSLINKNPIKNTIHLNNNIIITGPNASGKTTILKTSLINIILTQQIGCGFYEKSKFSPFKFIHCYLNIPDTSGRDSLFQAEARRCKNIIDIIQENDKDSHFCAFDELYSGTNPDEAISSALAFMNYLITFKKVNCMLTTHFIELCKHLETTKSFENCHMETKMIENKDGSYNDFNYTYLLKKNISTVSGGIKVLKDMNYPDEIIMNSLSRKNNYTIFN
jgi:DNA mismatch repair ATPase MutS